MIRMISIYDIFTTILFVLSGITISSARFLIGIFLALGMTGIVYQTILPQWMQKLIYVDSANLSYISEVMSYNQYNNPLHRGVAILLMGRNAIKHTTSNKKVWKIVAIIAKITT